LGQRRPSDLTKPTRANQKAPMLKATKGSQREGCHRKPSGSEKGEGRQNDGEDIRGTGPGSKTISTAKDSIASFNYK